MEAQILNLDSDILNKILNKLNSIELEIKELKKGKEDFEMYEILNEMNKNNLIGKEKDLEKYGIKL